MTKPIAVVSYNLITTVKWLKETLPIKEVNFGLKRVVDRIGREYVIIQNPEEALSWEFSDMIIAPDYNNLINLVKSRIR